MTELGAGDDAVLLSSRSREAAEQAGNEADLRHHLWLFFQPWATRSLKLDQSNLSHEGTGSAGRFDSRIGRAIIEYKAPGSLASATARAAAAAQALDYIEDPVMAADVVVITDGSTWAHYRDSSAPPEIGEQITMDLGGASPSVAPIDRFTWRDNGPDSCARILRLISTVRTSPVTSTTVALKLGIGRQEVRQLIAALATTLAARQPDDRTDILFRQWIQLAGVSYGIANERASWPARSPSSLLGERLGPILSNYTYAEALFSLHTYVAFASKVIGTELLSLGSGSGDKRPTSWASLDAVAFAGALSAMENGTISTELRAPGLLAGDLFGWYAPHAVGDSDLAGAVRALLVVLGELAWARIANSARGITSDLLRDFYADVVPRPLRRALGEFFTPLWLAEQTLSRGVAIAGKEQESARVLDPSCGSGTFLVAALKRELAIQDRLNPDSRSASTIAALERVIGFDINPVAVLMSRINMILALGDRIESLSAVVPRVYEADSILLPDPMRGPVELHEQSDFRRLPLTIGEIDVPGVVATLRGLHALRENVERGIDNSRDAATFRLRLRIDLEQIGVDPAALDEAVASSERIYERIQGLHSSGRDGVWGRIIEQSFAPATLEPVDLVVGNPPWINWKHLPDAWQERSKVVWAGWGLWATKRRGGGVPLADISSLLLARSVATYGRPGTVVAFLLPQSTLIADPGNERMRRCHLKPDDSPLPGTVFRPRAVDDWTQVKPFSPDAGNLPIALYVTVGEAPSWPIPMAVWRRVRARTSLRSDHHWGQIAPLLTADETSIAPVEPNNNGSPWVPEGGLTLVAKHAGAAEYTWGQGFHTHGLDGYFIYEVLSEAPDPDGLVLVRNVPSSGKNTAREAPREGRIEAKFLWPLARGKDVNRFRISASNLYALMAHHPQNPNRYLTREELIAFGPHLYDYLEPWLDALASRFSYGKLQPSRDAPWGVRGPTEHFDRNSTLVLCRYMHPAKRPPAAVASPRFDTRLGLHTTVYPNNKSNIHVPRTADEARYIAAWLNSSIAGDAISRIASSTTIGPTTLHRLPVPRFERADPVHVALVALAEAEEAGIDIDGSTLDALVAETLTPSPPGDT